MPVVETSKCPTNALHLVVQLGSGGDGINRFRSLDGASVKLRHTPHHRCVPHLGSTVVPDHIGRNAKQPRKGIFVMRAVTASCLEGRLEDVGQEIFGSRTIYTARQVPKDRRGVALDDEREGFWVNDRLADYGSVRIGTL